MTRKLLYAPGAAVALAALLACAGPTMRDEPVEMRDGTALATDVYLPKRNGGPWPVLVVRTPYDKVLLGLLVPSYRNAGVAVVIQDTRGRFASEGVDGVFLTDGDGELKDGYDTLAWVDEQSWSDGRVATWGYSALGIVQYAAAPTAAPGWKGMVAGVATPSFYDHALFPGGVFRESLVEGWLGNQGSSFFLDDIAEHPYRDAFWDPVQTEPAFDQVEVAGVHIGGWYDIFPQGPIDAFVGYQHDGGEGARGHQHLIMGPWTHGGLEQRAQGELSYPQSAAEPPVGLDAATRALLDAVLEPETPLGALSLSEVPAVQFYVMGDVDDPSAPGNEWRTAEDWPVPAAPVRLHLGADGLLAEACPSGTATTTYTFDPADPSPTLCGGNLLIAAGPCDQRAVESRSDTVVFETPVLPAPLEVTGHVRAHLFVSLEAPDADLMVRLTDVYPDGRSMLVTDGAARVAARGSATGITPVEPDEVVEVVVDLASTSLILATGHQLRISVTSSNWPRFSVNQGNGLPWPESRDQAGEPFDVTVHHGEAAASYLEIPDPNRQIDDFVTCP